MCLGILFTKATVILRQNCEKFKQIRQSTHSELYTVNRLPFDWNI